MSFSAEHEKALLIMRRSEAPGARQTGERSAPALKAEARNVLSSGNGIDIEYVSISDPNTLRNRDHERAVYAVAVRIGKQD
jgi:pantothenate synthetase